MMKCYLCGGLTNIVDQQDDRCKYVEWCDNCDYGRSTFNFNDKVYTEEYAKKYEQYLHDPVGIDITAFRIWFTLQNCENSHNLTLLDFGCATGQFAQGIGRFYNVWAVDINQTYKSIWDKYARTVNYTTTLPNQTFDIVAFFDSLEHIEDPLKLLQSLDAEEIVISIPIVSKNNLAKSKHLKPTEHLFYFTESGLKNLFHTVGYTCHSKSWEETKLGRESIGTFYFKRDMWVQDV